MVNQTYSPGSSVPGQKGPNSQQEKAPTPPTEAKSESGKRQRWYNKHRSISFLRVPKANAEAVPQRSSADIRKDCEEKYMSIIEKSKGVEHRVKLVVVGDGACGKTCFLVSFSKGIFPEVFGPSIVENYITEVKIGRYRVELCLWETPASDDYDRLRPLSYPDSHVFLVCFDISSPDSLDRIQGKWISEVRRFCPETPVILVGLKNDLRAKAATIAEPSKDGSPELVSVDLAQSVADKISAVCYVECSARTQEGLDDVFRIATTVAVGSMLQRRAVERSKCIIA